MGFESGAMSFRAFYMPRGLPPDVVERFAKAALPPIERQDGHDLNGWVGSRHLLDRVITEDNAMVCGYLRLNLVKVERKVPEALLRAECKMEELAALQASDKGFLNRTERSKIRKGIIDRLLPKMPPTLTGIPVVYDGNSRMLYAGTTSDKRTDALIINFNSVTGVAPVPVDTVTAGRKRKKLDVATLGSVSFSPDLADDLASSHLGQDFLTWLWFYSEAKGGVLTIEGDEYGIMIEGPLMFYMEGGGAHVAVLKDGSPLQSAEAKTALMSGKKLCRAKVTISRGEEMWSSVFDANAFIFRGFKPPKNPEKLDPYSAFQERMIALDKFMGVFLSFYDRFLDDRYEPASWKAVQKDVHKWVTDRTVKK